MKQCAKCNVFKEDDDFYQDDKMRDGRHSYCKSCVRGYMKKHRKGTKDACFQAYGGYVCACCQETESKFLTLDHINNDGAAHRKVIHGSGTNLYEWLKANNFPDGFQVLCMNCNFGKARNGGICPHKLVLQEVNNEPTQQEIE